MPRKRKPIKKPLTETPEAIQQGHIVRLDGSLMSFLSLSAPSKPSPKRKYNVCLADLVLIGEDAGKKSLAGFLESRKTSSAIQVRPAPQKAEEEEKEGGKAKKEKVTPLLSISEQIENLKGTLSTTSKRNFKDHFKKSLNSTGIRTEFLVLAKPKLKTGAIPDGAEGSLIMNHSFIGIVFDKYISKVSEVVDIRKDMATLMSAREPHTGRKLTIEERNREKVNAGLALGILGISLRPGTSIFLDDITHMGSKENMDGGLKLIRQAETRRCNTKKMGKELQHVQLKSCQCSHCGTAIPSFPFMKDRNRQMRTGINLAKCRSCDRDFPDYNTIDVKTFFVSDGIIWTEGKEISNLMGCIKKTYSNIFNILCSSTHYTQGEDALY